MQLTTTASPEEVLEALEAAGICASVSTEDERLESLHAARDEWYAHGDPDLRPGEVDSHGNSEYDYNPGVRYNDGGEPLGYM
jgi:hypothetical protein